VGSDDTQKTIGPFTDKGKEVSLESSGSETGN